MFRVSITWALATGCGLTNSASVSLDLPPKTFTIDASGWQVTQSGADVYLATKCDPTQTSVSVCATAAMTACPMNCTGACDALARTCDLALEVAAHQAVDLLTDQPSLQSLADHADVTVTVDRVQYQVADNTLNITTPPMTIYVAPMSATQPTDMGATAIATIDSVPAGTLVAQTDLEFLPGGEATLTAAMSDFENPFTVIVGATITLDSEDPLPTGKLDASVQINAHATP
jgi:acetolactate synthase regulatory subunit